MEVRPRAATRAAELADFLMRADLLAARDGDAVQVCVVRDDAVPVVDLDELSVGVAHARIGHHPRGGAVDGRAKGGGEVDAGMEAWAPVDGIDARAERALELVLAERRGQRQGLQKLAQSLLAPRLVLGRGVLGSAERDVGTALAFRRAAQAC